MGCSPSRGINFNGVQGTLRNGKTLLQGTEESAGQVQSDNGNNEGLGSGESDGEAAKRGAGEKRSNCPRNTTSTSVEKRPSQTELIPETGSEKLGTQEITVNVLLPAKEKQGEKQDGDEKRGSKKPKKGSKSVKPNKRKEKDKKTSTVNKKIDFPEPLVKAHQAAYSFLNPSINKYEALLHLFDQAAQTQISLQPMVAFLALRYEEINQGLEEMADEGEKLLKENGEHLAWPCHMKNLSSAKNGPSSTPADPPPDLLQQLLQYTIQRMQLVGQSVSGIGDSALEEAVDFFSSLSELLEEKLKAKRASEARLMQLLSRIEAASLRKPGPEDSALFSEDSGIGAESWSLAGSEKKHRRRESCDSSGTNRTTPCSPTTPSHQGAFRRAPIRKMSTSSSLNSITSTCTIAANEHKYTESLQGSMSLDDDDGQEDDVEEDEGDEERDSKNTGRKRSNSSPPDPCHQPRRLPAKRIENPQNVEMTLKMKDAISGRIRFVPSQSSPLKIKQTGSPKNNRRQWTEEEEKGPKRPQTAAPGMSKKKTPVTKQCRSRSAESLRSKAEDPTLLELERTQKELNKRLENMDKVKFEGNLRRGAPKQGQRLHSQTFPAAPGCLHPLTRNPLAKQDKSELDKHSTAEQCEENEVEMEKKKKDKKSVKGPLKATPPPTPQLSSLDLYSGSSVKRLINTFSQGVEDSKKSPESGKVLGPLKGVRKCGVPVIPGLSGRFTFNESEGTTQGDTSNPGKTDEFDLDNLPPPSLEVLMDNSFEGMEANEKEQGMPSRGRSTVPKKTTMSQRLRASIQSVSVLPSRRNLRPSSHSMSPARSIQQDISVACMASHPDAKSGMDPESEEAASLYQQSRKIIHLRHSADSPTEKAISERGSRKSTLCRSNATSKQGVNSPPETVPSTPVVNGPPPATPPTSRARILPPTPVLQRRLPSPPVRKGQSSAPASSSSPVSRKLPTPPPASQRTLPSTPATRQEMTPSHTSGQSYPFKAPSPPASPRVQRWSRENSSEDSSSKVCSNARSVFCPASPSLFEAHPIAVPKPPQAWTSTGGSVLPRPWGERGRLPMSVRGPQPFVRRSQSDRRPSLSVPPRMPTVSVAQTCGSEPAISTQGLEDSPTREEEVWDSQSEFPGATRSVSHPDLCIVGQALQRE